jgi:hypothetical protein
MFSRCIRTKVDVLLHPVSSSKQGPRYDIFSSCHSFQNGSQWASSFPTLKTNVKNILNDLPPTTFNSPIPIVTIYGTFFQTVHLFQGCWTPTGKGIFVSRSFFLFSAFDIKLKTVAAVSPYYPPTCWFLELYMLLSIVPFKITMTQHITSAVIFEYQCLHKPSLLPVNQFMVFSK